MMKRALSVFLAAVTAVSALVAADCMTVSAGAVTWNEYTADTGRGHLTISKKIYGSYAELIINLPKQDVEEAKAAIKQNHDNKLFVAWYDLGCEYMLNATMKYDPETGDIVTVTGSYDKWGHDAQIMFEGVEYKYTSRSVEYDSDVKTDSKGNTVITFRLLTDEGLGHSLATRDDIYSDVCYRFTYYITGGVLDKIETEDYIKYEEGLSEAYYEPSLKYRDYEEELISNSTRNIAEATISKIPKMAYTGKAVRPAITITDGGKKLVKGKDYKVSYFNNTDIGVATATIGGIGDYSGGKGINFMIVPARVKISGKITKTKVSLSWDKVKGADGYEVCCSYKNNGFSLVADVTSTKYVKKDIYSANKYRYKVRAYKNVNGNKIYGAWSKVIKAS